MIPVCSVLVVEDDCNAREALRCLLEDEGFVVRTAADGIAALAELTAFSADVVVTDVRMPRMNGCTLLEALRERPGRMPKVIFMSAGPRPDETTPCLPKPFAVEDLLALMRA